MGFFGNKLLEQVSSKIIANDKAVADAKVAKDAADAKVVSDKAAQDQKYFDTVQKRKDNIAMQKNAAINASSVPAKTTKFNLNSQTVNPVINGVATGQNFFKPKYTKMKKGGSVKSKVSTASKRGDGCAIKGKTKGRMV
jgi:hypothetical protein